MEAPEYVLVIVNLVTGLACAVPIASRLRRINDAARGIFPCLGVVIGIYFLECVFLVMGMGIPVFSVGLAFVWGIALGFWLRRRTSARPAVKLSFLLALYSSLPAFSFIIIPVLFWFGGHHVLSAAQGGQLGIPRFFPFPLNTILGFYGACAIGALVFKTVITTGVVSLLMHLVEKPGAG